jgi:hypothetical protein
MDDFATHNWAWQDNKVIQTPYISINPIQVVDF